MKYENKVEMPYRYIFKNKCIVSRFWQTESNSLNNFAISSGGIGEALERSASSLMAANATLDESVALITASNQVVQDPVAVGTAWKTISMRMKSHCPQ